MNKSDLIYEVTAALVALSVVMGGVIVTLVQLVKTGSTIDLPSWLATSVGAVIGFYFGRRASSSFTNGGVKRYVEPLPYVEEPKHGV